MKAVLVDDERLARKELTKLLEAFPEIEIIGECSNGKEAIAFINEKKPDLVFMDIEMPELSGFDVVEQIDKTPAIVFVTAYNDYAIKAFEVNASDYLVKPVDPARLKETIEKINADNEEVDTDSLERTTLTSGDQIFIKDGEKCWFIKLDEIKLFESEGNYVRIYFRNFKPLVLKSLNNLEAKLDPRLFFRANRKYIINLDTITHVENWFNGGLQVTLENDRKIEISRRQAVKFKAMMSL
ncbi:LytR/AlgR family response regulator transcription factor [Parvicella tangerina]|uniref:Transcriptional regulatory protein BtsR n=1 Tax=Parvicella tangerina TaxID=2829795 RepID=A0A916JQY6_9FLAO|nr:response regulator [Parvicella tangerina]CAG5087043.1 Transcriptional regulatory protein BtsR [Parvicella tangerina]